MKFGPFKSIVIIGGGSLVQNLIPWITEKKIPFGLITSTRQSKLMEKDEKINNIKNKFMSLCLKKLDRVKINKFIRTFHDPFFISIGAAWIFKKEILEIFDDNLYNLHGTRLPLNRGGATMSWQILMGNKLGSCLIHKVNEGIDKGDVIFYDEFLYNACRTPLEYHQLYVSKNIEFFKKIFSDHFNKTTNVKISSQPEYLSTYWPRLDTKTNGWIDWNLKPKNIENFICAFDDPYAGASTYLNKKIVRLKKVLLNSGDGVFHNYQNGIIFRKNKKWINIALGEYSLIVNEILDHKGNDIFKNLREGDRFYTPLSVLDSSKSRVQILPSG